MAEGKWVTTPADSQWFLQNYAKYLNNPDANRSPGQVYGYVDTGGSGTEKFYKAPSDYTMGLSHKLNAQGQFLDYTGSQIAQGTPYTPTAQDINSWFHNTNATSQVNPDNTISWFQQPEQSGFGAGDPLGALLTMAGSAAVGGLAASGAGIGAGASDLSGFLSPEISGLAGQTGVNLTGGAMDLGDWQNWGDLLGNNTTSGLDFNTTNFPDLNPDTANAYDTALRSAGIDPSSLPSLPSGVQNLLKSLLGGSSGSGGSGGLGSLLSGGSGLGALLGALAGGLGANQKPAGVTTTVQDIPDYLKGYQAMNLASGVNNFGAAGQGGSLLPGAQNYLQNTINGAYLDPNQNPAFQPYVQDLMGQAGSAFNARYGATPEALNNSGNQEGFTRAVTAAALPLYNSAFQTAQGNQFNAAQNAPGFASNYAGATLAPNLAFKNLYTGPQATSTPYFSNTAGGILSGGLAGSQLGKLFG